MRRLVLIALCALLALAVGASAALAATTPAQPAPAGGPPASATPVALSQLQATLHDDAEGGPIMLVSGRVAKGVQTPATIALPIPTGAQVIWAGETLGGDVSKDPERPYTIVKRDGYDLALLTLQQATDGQIEVSMPSAVVPNGTAKNAFVTLPIPAAVGEAAISIRVPVTAQVTTSTAGLARQAGPSGFAYYTVRQQAPKPGTPLQASLTFVSGGPAPAGPGTGTGSGPTGGTPPFVVWLIGAAVLGGFVLFGRSVSRKMAEKQPAAAAPKAAKATASGGSHFFEDDAEPETPKQPAKGAQAKASSAKKTSAAAKKQPAKETVVETAPARKVSPTFLVVGIVAAVVIAVAAFGGGLKDNRVQAGGQAVEGGVQKFTVDTSTGQFDPSEIQAKAGMPIEITFGPGTGCTSAVTFQQFNIKEDLKDGGTVKLPALTPGRYDWLCGSNSGGGTVVVQ